MIFGAVNLLVVLRTEPHVALSLGHTATIRAMENCNG